MRELRVIGLTPDATYVVCADTETGQKFRLTVDEKLRAASRGDIARFGQIEIEMDSTMRPRDIQARIRAGASVEQVAAAAGMPADRVERFAYPVLLERSRAAELAKRGHPVLANGPALQTLIEVVTAAFRARGHNIDDADWDAWKDESGHWVAQLQWQTGRSSNSAHWQFQQDAHGGTVTPLDDAATALVDPDFGRRGLAAVPKAVSLRPEPPMAKNAEKRDPVDEYFEDVPRESAVVQEEPVEEVAPVAAAGGAPAAAAAGPTPAAKAAAAAKTPPTKTASKAVPAQETGKDPAAGLPKQQSKGKRGKPEMPSWEDVLLGVRSSGSGH